MSVQILLLILIYFSLPCLQIIMANILITYLPQLCAATAHLSDLSEVKNTREPKQILGETLWYSAFDLLQRGMHFQDKIKGNADFISQAQLLMFEMFFPSWLLLHSHVSFMCLVLRQLTAYTPVQQHKVTNLERFHTYVLCSFAFVCKINFIDSLFLCFFYFFRTCALILNALAFSFCHNKGKAVTQVNPQAEHKDGWGVVFFTLAHGVLISLF